LKLGALAAVGIVFVARTASAACQGRPTDAAGFADYSYGAAEVKSYGGAKVRVHYATSGPHAPALATTRPDGVPDTVAFAADTGDAALAAYATLGYNAVPSDAQCSSNGSDDKVDIYLVHFVGADGSTFAECPGAFAPKACSSFALVESTFQGKGYADAQEGFLTVVTHELFHAVQNTYKSMEAGYWAEGTAQWAMHHVHPELPDFSNQMPPFFADPSRSIDNPPPGAAAGYLYGSAVWPLFLSLRHGDDFIRKVFEAESNGNQDPMVAIAGLTSMADDYPAFAAWNVGTGTQKSTGGYPDAAKYPGIKPAGLTEGTHDITSGFGYFAYKGTLPGEAGITLDTDATRNAGVVVPIVNDTLQLDQAKKLPANGNGEVLVVVAGITAKKTDAPFTIHFGDPVSETPPDAGTAPKTVSKSDGGGCQTAGSSSFSPFGLFALLGLGALRFRRRS
jgi:MYXO-CTERM domain-containing protein